MGLDYSDVIELVFLVVIAVVGAILQRKKGVSEESEPETMAQPIRRTGKPSRRMPVRSKEGKEPIKKASVAAESEVPSTGRSQMSFGPQRGQPDLVPESKVSSTGRREMSIWERIDPTRRLGFAQRAMLFSEIVGNNRFNVPAVENIRSILLTARKGVV